MFVYLTSNRQTAFVHIPKTGGTAVKKLVLEPMGLKRIGHRDGPLPFIPGDPFVFTFIRNPYRRFASMFHFISAIEIEGLEPQRFATPKEFIDRQNGLTIPYVYHWCQWEMVGPATEIFRFEFFASEVLRLCARLDVKPPTLVKTEATQWWGDYRWRDCIDKYAHGQINERAADDFKFFGYPLLTWKQFDEWSSHAALSIG